MSNETLQIKNRDIKQKIIPVQKNPLLPDDKNDILIILLDGSSKEEKKRLQKAYKYANIVEENQLKYLNKEQKKSFSTISFHFGEKRDLEKVADLFSKIFDKDKTYKVTVIFRESFGLTEEQKKAYVDKLKKSLEDNGIKVSVASYKNQELKSSKMKAKLEKRNRELKKLSKEGKLKNQVSQTFGKVEKSRNSYTI